MQSAKYSLHASIQADILLITFPHDMHHTAALQKIAALTKKRYIALRFQKKHRVGYIPS